MTEDRRQKTAKAMSKPKAKFQENAITKASFDSAQDRRKLENTKKALSWKRENRIQETEFRRESISR
jgi:hypothetical protein